MLPLASCPCLPFPLHDMLIQSFHISMCPVKSEFPNQINFPIVQYTLALTNICKYVFCEYKTNGFPLTLFPMLHQDRGPMSSAHHLTPALSTVPGIHLYALNMSVLMNTLIKSNKEDLNPPHTLGHASGLGLNSLHIPWLQGPWGKTEGEDFKPCKFCLSQRKLLTHCVCQSYVGWPPSGEFWQFILCVNLTGLRDAQIADKPFFLGMFVRMLVDWRKKVALPSVGRHHPMLWGQRKEEKGPGTLCQWEAQWPCRWAPCSFLEPSVQSQQAWSTQAEPCTVQELGTQNEETIAPALHGHRVQ